MKTFVKDPDGILDYAWDWSEWLTDTDSIDSYIFIIPEDFTKTDESVVDGVVTLWFSGGVVNKSYTVSCRITTTEGRTDDRSFIFNIEER